MIERLSALYQIVAGIVAPLACETVFLKRV